MRLFVALEIPAAVRAEVEAFLGEHRPSFPRARWVRLEGLHLTLVFLGETAADRLPALRAAYRSVFAGGLPIELSLAGGGFFPPRGPARALWLGANASPELARLQQHVEAASCEILGRQAEARAFSPHLTLARLPEPWPRAEVERFRECAARPFGAPFAVQEGVLMESLLGPGGSRYHVVERFPLRAGP
jgi:RNA 2',3'-cyclic 3'-phosphodiesterase